MAVVSLTRIILALTLALVAFSAPHIWAAAPATAPAGEDWPQFLGPTRDGVYHGEALVNTFPPGGPKVVWQMELGSGWASPVIVSGKVLIFHRVKDDAVLDCLDAATGKPIWQSKYPTEYVDGFGFESGPRATPCVAGGRVFTLGAEGLARAVDLATGKEIWSVDTVKAFKAQNGFFGLACSPLVEGDVAIFQIGGQPEKNMAQGTVALDVTTGKLKWGVLPSKDAGAGYSSPIATTLGGKRCLVQVDRDGLAVADFATEGRLLLRLPFRSRQHASVNAATPLVVGDELFLSASYNTGAKLLRFDPKAMDKPTVVWENDESMSSHYATCVVKDGLLFGFHGRQEQGPDFRCIEWATGKVRWNQEAFGAGTVTLAGDKLVILTDKGELVLAEAQGNSFKEMARAQVLGRETRAYPAISHGMIYARDKNRLVCLNLSPK